MSKGTMWIALCAIVGLGLLLAGLAPAQPQNSNGTMNSNANGNMNGNMSGMNHNMAQSSDMKFMTTAAQGGMAEVALARYAVDHATSDAVKQYAQRMLDDHTNANNELMQIATSKGITLPTTPDPKHQQMMDKMMKLTGADFDREYIKQAGVKDHAQMEKLFMGESSKGRDADAKAFAAKTLPTVQEHLRMARDMSGSMTNMGHGSNSNANTSMHSNSNSNSNNSNR